MRSQDARQVDGPGLVAHAAGLAAKRVAEEGQPFLMRVAMATRQLHALTMPAILLADDVYRSTHGFPDLLVTVGLAESLGCRLREEARVLTLPTPVYEPLLVRPDRAAEHRPVFRQASDTTSRGPLVDAGWQDVEGRYHPAARCDAPAGGVWDPGLVSVPRGCRLALTATLPVVFDDPVQVASMQERGVGFLVASVSWQRGVRRVDVRLMEPSGVAERAGRDDPVVYAATLVAQVHAAWPKGDVCRLLAGEDTTGGVERLRLTDWDVDWFVSAADLEGRIVLSSRSAGWDGERLKQARSQSDAQAVHRMGAFLLSCVRRARPVAEHWTVDQAQLGVAQAMLSCEEGALTLLLDERATPSDVLHLVSHVIAGQSWSEDPPYVQEASCLFACLVAAAYWGQPACRRAVDFPWSRLDSADLLDVWEKGRRLMVALVRLVTPGMMTAGLGRCSLGPLPMRPGDDVEAMVDQPPACWMDGRRLLAAGGACVGGWAAIDMNVGTTASTTGARGSGKEQAWAR